MTRVDVRDAQASDLSQMLAIYNRAIECTTAVFHYRPRSEEQYAAWFRDKQALKLPVLVASVGTKVVGSATFGPFRAWPGFKYTVEHSLYVAEGARRNGTGRALLTALMDRAERYDLRVMVAGVDADNEPSLRLHASLGFEKVGHLPEVGFKFGRYLDLVLLQKILKGPREPCDG